MSQDISAKSLEEQFGEDAVTPFSGGAFAVRGHWLYVKKLERPDEGVIALPEKTKGSYDVYRILAKGVRVGKKRSDGHGWSKSLRGRLGVSLHVPDAFKLGDDVVIPNGQYAEKLMRHSLYENDEFFVDESIPICIAEN